MKEKRFIKRFLAMVNVMVMCISLLGVMVSPKMIVKADGMISNPRISEDGTVTWDVVQFGNYYQDAQIETKAIKWRILSINDDGSALLITDKVIDCNPYNESCEDITWKDCSLRKWLNDYFYNTAFTSKEQGLINNTLVVNDNTSECDVDSGEDTIDKVYALSMDDVQDNKYGFGGNTTNIANHTSYAKMNGLSISKDSYENNCCWWLRTTGQRNDRAVLVDRYGDLSDVYAVSNSDVGVRPVLQINLDDELISDAGTVTSQGIETVGSDRKANEYSNPIIDQENNISTWDCVFFGKYMQNVTIKKQPLEWRVLSVDGGNALLLSDKVIDYKSYRGELWDDDKFINDAFTEEEQSAIKHISFENDKVIMDDTSEEMAFLLSRAEMLNTSFGFEGCKISKARQAKATDYARFQGTTCNDEGYCDWMLREETSDEYDNDIDSVTAEGSILTSACSFNNPMQFLDYSIRPAIYVNINSEYIKPLKTVTSPVDLNNELYQLDGKRYYKVTFYSEEGYLRYYSSRKVGDSEYGEVMERYVVEGDAEDKTTTVNYEAGKIDREDAWGGDYEGHSLLGWTTEDDDTIYVMDGYGLKQGQKYLHDYVVKKDVTFKAVWIDNSVQEANDYYSVIFYSEEGYLCHYQKGQDGYDTNTVIGGNENDKYHEIKVVQGDKIWSARCAWGNQARYKIIGWKLADTNIILDLEDVWDYVPSEDVIFVAQWGEIKNIDSGNGYSTPASSGVAATSGTESEDSNTSQSDNTSKPSGYEIGEVVTDKNNKYTVDSEDTVIYEDNENDAVTSVIIPDTVVLNGREYNVTGIYDGAFSKKTKLKKVTIGSNVEIIGKNAFFGNKKLKTITIKSTKIKKISKNAFKKINNKAIIYVPKSLSKKKFVKYKKMLKESGIPKTVKIKKNRV